MPSKRWIFMAILLAGAALRLAGIGGDLWLDEIWSLRVAMDASSLLDIFTSIHLDNNHYLNTVYLYWMGPGLDPYVYRLVSWMAGAAAMTLFSALAWQRSQREGMLLALMIAVSCPLLIYSTEARGYSLALLFAALSFRCARSGSRWLPVPVVLGLLSHLTFLFVYAALIAYMAAGPRTRWRPLAAQHALPVALLFALYRADLRFLSIGGGDRHPLTEVAGRFAAAALGFPEHPAGWFVAGVLLVLAAASQIRRISGTEPALAFFFTTLLAVPVVAAALSQSYLHPRYFIVCLPFLLWLIAMRICTLPVHLAGALMFLYIGGQIYWLQPFLRNGRGHYRQAVEYMRDHSARDIVTVSSDHDFRNRTVLDYYAGPFCGKPFLYLHSSHRGIAPEWLIFHSEHRPAEMPASRLSSGRVYRLEKAYPASGLSGLSWFLYHRRADDVACRNSPSPAAGMESNKQISLFTLDCGTGR